MPNGFIKTGTGPKGARFGRDPETGRAFKADGTVRKARKTLTPQERMKALAEQQNATFRTIGRTVIKAAPSLAAFVAALGTFRKWVRDCKAYGSPEAMEARRAYHRAQLDAIEAKGEAAQDWLPDAQDVSDALADVGQSIGRALAESGEELTTEVAEAIVAKHLPANVREMVEAAADPDNDPFAGLRRDDLAVSDDDEQTDDDEL